MGDMKLFIAIALIAAVSAMPNFNERQAKQLGTNAQRKIQQKLQEAADQNGVGIDVNAKVQEAQSAVEALIEQYKQTHQAEIQQGKQQGMQQCQAARNCNQQVGSLIEQHRGQAEQQANNLVRQGQQQMRNL